MNISRNAFIKRIIGGLAAVGIGAKVAGKRPDSMPGRHYTGVVKLAKDHQRLYNRQMSDLAECERIMDAQPPPTSGRAIMALDYQYPYPVSFQALEAHRRDAKQLSSKILKAVKEIYDT